MIIAKKCPCDHAACTTWQLNIGTFYQGCGFDKETAQRIANLMNGVSMDNADVKAFQEKFDVPMSPVPAFIDNHANTFRIDFMHEELQEYQEACDHQDLAKAADALVDLVYVAHGTALMMGLPWDNLWAEVQRANMSKVRAKSDGSDSKRKSSLDVVKPPGWQAPNHHQYLMNAAITGSYFDTTTRTIK